MRRKYQLTHSRVQLHNRLESLLEETQIKLSSLVFRLAGVSGRRILRAIAEGYSDPVALADLADRHLRATGEQLRDALEPAAELISSSAKELKMVLGELEMIERQKAQLEHEMAMLLSPYQDTAQRLAEVPGLGVHSAQQILAEVGVRAATFPSAKKLASWVGICPGFEKSAGISKSHRCPNGNRHMRRILNQCALASVRSESSDDPYQSKYSAFPNW